jgi:hypothetical protein
VITTMRGDLALMTGIEDPVLAMPITSGTRGITLRDPDVLRRSHARVHLPKTGRLDGLAVDAGREIVVVHKELPRIFGGRNKTCL